MPKGHAMNLKPEAMQFLLPYSNENQWSDLLAVMITADSQPLLDHAGIKAHRDEVIVKREVSKSRGDKRDRIDIVVSSNSESARPLIALECKVLADLGHEQLDHYSETHDAERKYLVCLPLRKYPHPEDWTPLFWAELISLFVDSTDSWVTFTARGWLDYLEKTSAVVDTSQWNQMLSHFSTPIHDLQLKSAFLCEHANQGFTLGSSTAGGKPLLCLRLKLEDGKFVGKDVYVEVEDAIGRGTVEAEEGDQINVRGLKAFFPIWQDLDDPKHPEYEWEPLERIYPTLRDSGINWSGTSARKKKFADDEKNLGELLKRGFPRSFAKGYRDDRRKFCEYGPKSEPLPADATMQDIIVFLNQLNDLAWRCKEVLESA